MTTESGADSEGKQPQENKETEKGKAKAAAEPTSPQNQPEQLPAAAGHSTPARKEQVSLSITAVSPSFLCELGLQKEDPTTCHQPLEFSINHLPFNILFHILSHKKTLW